uniref:Uncharacterized protein n=1 Tax=Anguilla anguilla TaxID=7936 RepID=A0A0E9WBS3_ANGAN
MNSTTFSRSLRSGMLSLAIRRKASINLFT